MRYKPSICAARGFTVTELLVVFGIFALLSGVVLARYRTFDTNARFVNASEDVVLALRQAQVYGVGVKGSGTSFDIPYGVYFSKASPSQMIIFADNNSDGFYGSGDTVIDTVKWQSNIVMKTSYGLICDGSDVPGALVVTFKRPNPDAAIKQGSGATCALGSIVLTDSNTGKFATTTITSAGQLSLQ